MTVLTDDLLASFDESVGPVDEARLLPPVLYTSPEFYEFERRAIFQRDWLCVGRTDQLAEPGDFRSISIAGEPLIAVRDSDGELRVISAVCRHRGMVIVEGSGNCRRFTCPYHHWTYGLDGALLGTPAMDRAVSFDRSDHSLPELKVEVWQGFIMANFGHDARPFGPTMTKATSPSRSATAWSRRRWRTPCSTISSRLPRKASTTSTSRTSTWTP